MVLEATIIIIDNSKYAVNGDILPSRFDAQSDALNKLATAKLDENQESGVGLMLMGGRNVEVDIFDRGVADTCERKRSHNGCYFKGRGMGRL